MKDSTFNKKNDKRKKLKKSMWRCFPILSYSVYTFISAWTQMDLHYWQQQLLKNHISTTKISGWLQVSEYGEWKNQRCCQLTPKTLFILIQLGNTGNIQMQLMERNVDKTQQQLDLRFA